MRPSSAQQRVGRARVAVERHAHRARVDELDAAGRRSARTAGACGRRPPAARRSRRAARRRRRRRRRARTSARRSAASRGRSACRRAGRRTAARRGRRRRLGAERLARRGDRARHDRVVGRGVRVGGPALAVAADPARPLELRAAARRSRPASRRTARSRRRGSSRSAPGRLRVGDHRLERRAGCRARRRAARARPVCSIGPGERRAAARTRPTRSSSRGPTLSLRYARAEDAPRLFELASDPAVTRFFSWGPYTDIVPARGLHRLAGRQARARRAARLPDRPPRGRADRRHRPLRALGPQPPRHRRLVVRPPLVGQRREPRVQGADRRAGVRAARAWTG